MLRKFMMVTNKNCRLNLKWIEVIFLPFLLALYLASCTSSTGIVGSSRDGMNVLIIEDSKDQFKVLGVDQGPILNQRGEKPILSPDGEWYMYNVSHEWWLGNVRTGKERRVAVDDEIPFFLPDGSILIVSKREQTYRMEIIRRYDADIKRTVLEDQIEYLIGDHFWVSDTVAFRGYIDKSIDAWTECFPASSEASMNWLIIKGKSATLMNASPTGIDTQVLSANLSSSFLSLFRGHQVAFQQFKEYLRKREESADKPSSDVSIPKTGENMMFFDGEGLFSLDGKRVVMMMFEPRFGTESIDIAFYLLDIPSSHSPRLLFKFPYSDRNMHINVLFLSDGTLLYQDITTKLWLLIDENGKVTPSDGLDDATMACGYH